MNWKRKGKELAGKNTRETAKKWVVKEREKVQTTTKERDGSWL